MSGAIQRWRCNAAMHAAIGWLVPLIGTDAPQSRGLIDEMGNASEAQG